MRKSIIKKALLTLLLTIVLLPISNSVSADAATVKKSYDGTQDHSYNSYKYYDGQGASSFAECLDADLNGADENGQGVESVTNIDSFPDGIYTSGWKDKVKKYIYYLVSNNYYSNENPSSNIAKSGVEYGGETLNISYENFHNALHIAIGQATGSFQRCVSQGRCTDIEGDGWGKPTKAAHYLITHSTADPANDPNFTYTFYIVKTSNAGDQNYIIWKREDKVKYGAFKIIKQLDTRGKSITENYDGFVFDIYNSRGELAGTVPLDANGEACFGYEIAGSCSGRKVLPVGTSYVVKERMNQESLNYKWTAVETSVNVVIANENEDSTVTYHNKLREFCIKIHKRDGGSEPNNPIYLGGVEFGVYSDSECSNRIATGTTNNAGYIEFSELLYEDIWYKELNAAPGYHNNNSSCKSAPAFEDTMQCNDEFVDDYKKYYCIKIDKKDVSSAMLSGAVFKATSSTSPSTTFTSTETSAGHYSIFVEDHSEQFNITETTAPDGYAPVDSFNVTPFLLSSSSQTYNQAKSLCLGSNTKDSSGSTPTPVTKVDKKLLLNWYKVTEDGTTRANGAKFKIKQKEGTKYIKVNGTETVTDTSNPSITKKCYKFHSLVDSESAASTLTSYDISEAQDGSMKGEVCISGIPKGTYTVIETKPAEYHTFGTYKTRDFTISNSSTVFKSITTNNKYINLPTEFEFDKYVTSGDDADWSSITTEMLKLIEFNVYDSDGNLVEFIKISDGTYVYAGNDIDGTSGTRVTGLYLGDDRKIHIKHLPKGTYSIKEKIDNNNGTCDCTLDGSCIGFFGPTYETESDYKFTITDCSNENATACSSYSVTIQSLNNTPTEIKFTKSDLYSYEDASDIVDFENDQERNDFDRIVFKLKDENGNYLRLVKVRNVGTCLTDDSYAEYRYVPEDMIDSLTEEQRANLTEELHTCGGHIRITHLCRGKKYYIEEVSVPENSVFTLPETVEARTREYTIPCCGEGSSTTTTAIIEDTPTRVRFEKRDSKYNYLIPDETTTFQVYQCKKGTTCHPADGITSDMKLIKFSPRAVIDGDREDPTDVAGLEGVEVYKAMSDSDVVAGKEFVTDLHPYHGILVLRYLSSGYNYVLLETKAPKNYTLPSGRSAETSFTVVNNTVNVDVTDMPNTPTGLIIRKYSDDGRLLTGARFKIYEGTTCDSHLTPMNQPKRELKVKTIRDGLYEARPVEDTNVIETCNNKNGICSSIPVDQVTSLTYTTYLGTWADFDNAINDRQEKVQLQEGEALIQYLEYGHCYIIEEIKAPDGYSLPKNAEDRFTMVTLDENERYIKDTYKTLVNTPTPFTFYKYDEYNQLLDGAEFKLQKLDKDKIYQDVTVTQVEKNGELYYKVDENSTNKTITTRGGKATIYYLSTGQYRVLETKAAPGKELSKNPNIATFFVDDSGNVYGDGIIINKAKTEKIEVKSSSSAEYIVGINTGQQVIRYGLIVAVLILGITGLIILNKKSK